MKKEKFNEILLIGILIFTLLSGAVRKWVTDNGNINNLVTFIQITVVYILFFLKGEPFLKKKNVMSVFIVYLLYLIVAAFNPASPSYYHAIAGLIVHSSFWFGLFFYITKKETIKINNFIYLVFVLIVLEAALAVLQYQLPREDILNQYAIQEEFTEEASLSIAMVGDAVRVSGTFSYISGYVAFVLFVQFFSFALFYNSKVSKYIPVLGLLLSLILAFLSGSRSSAILNVILTLSFILFQLKHNNHKKLIPVAAVTLLFSLIYISLGDPANILKFISNSFNNFDSRFEANKEEGIDRIYTPFKTILDNNFPNKLIGNGLGITYPAVVALKGTSIVAQTFWVQDDEMGRTLLEGGYLLLVLKFILIAFAIKNLEINKYFLAITFLIVFIYMPLTTNIYNIIFFLMGIIYLEQSILGSVERNNTNR